MYTETVVVSSLVYSVASPLISLHVCVLLVLLYGC